MVRSLLTQFPLASPNSRLVPAVLGLNVEFDGLLPAERERSLEGHDGLAYDVKFYGNGEDSLLLSCGDDGKIKGWRWKEFTELEAPITFQGNHMKPVLDLVNPQHKGPWGALSPIPKNNAIAVDPQGRSLFSAAGDSCAYCWDVEKGEIKMVFKGHFDYLHCILTRASSNQIITDSEYGTARIWGLWQWSKFVSIPASECISSISNHASIQDVVFDANQILAVGAEPVLNRFDMNGMTISQILCAPQSVFSVSLHPSGVIAIGGYGGLVDVMSQFGSHLRTFRSRCV